MQTVVVDSSVFISSLMGDEAAHEASRLFFQALESQKYLVILPLTGLLEVIHACYRLKADLKLEDFLMDHFIQLTQDKRLRLVPIESGFLASFLKHHHAFNGKTADAIMAVTAAKEHAPLVSWDIQLNKAAGGFVRTFTPSEFLAL